MKRLMVGTLLILLLAGCNSELTYSEIKIEKASKDVQEFIESVGDQGGPNLYFDGKKGQLFVYLNGSNVIQGEKATYFKDFELDVGGDKLKFLFNQHDTDDYSSKELKYKALYEVKLDKEYDQVEAYSNGQLVAFQLVSGNE